MLAPSLLCTMGGRTLLAGATVATAVCLLLAVAMDKTPPAVLILAKTKGLACGRCGTPHMVQAGLATRDSRRASRREAGDARRVNGVAALTIFCMPLRRWHTGVCFSQGRPLPCWPSVHS